MFVVRYVALAALVVWLGALQGALVGHRTAYFTSIAYLCGGVLIVALVTLKFVGPPPRTVFTRIGLVFLMLLVTLADRWLLTGMMPTIVNTVIGFTLLAWYARE